MDWLFPVAAMKHRETLARIEYDTRRREEYHKAIEPMMAIVRDVLPLIEEAELAGKTPMAIVIPLDRWKGMIAAGIATDDYFGRTDFMRNGMDGARLLGLPISLGDKLRVAF